MSMATRTDTRSPALHAADRHDLIRVQGARENNLKDVSVELPKRRLTVFTGVSGSGKSSLVFSATAAESQRMINETYSAFVQGFMPTLARPEVDVLDGLTTAIILDQERMGANPRSTVGTATDANAMLRILFSRLGKPHIGSPNASALVVTDVFGDRNRTLPTADAPELVAEGTDVVLHFSFWSRRMRDDYRRLFEPTGVVPETFYLATDRETVLNRDRARRGSQADDFVLTEELSHPFELVLLETR
jgi:hypothetical protein